MKRTEVVVVGAGQAGLAMSYCLSVRGIDHVVLERGQVGERWRSERWNSLRLLTPNWMTRLPGSSYDGPDPDGFMTMPETVRLLENYARLVRAPVECGVKLLSAGQSGAQYRIVTEQGEWTARALLIATGYNDIASVPAMSTSISQYTTQITPREYQCPDQLPDGCVLVVGASATGVQLAEEIHASGRPVTLSVGQHTRMPRRYRGRDIMWWLDQLGNLSKSRAEMPDLATDSKEPSLQLVGSPEHRSIDLAVLRGMGVRLVGRISGMSGSCARFAGDLAETTAAANRRLARILSGIDAAVETGAYGQASPEGPAKPLLLHNGPLELDLAGEGITTVVWATGYRRSYPWLNIPVLDSRGEIMNDGGICPLPGLYVLGLNFMRRRNSSFIDGVGRDAEELAEHIGSYLAAQCRRAA
jgi:putative flavoprotein involved in K+ transport